jgi:3-oxoacyl-(acyl-carrier-protein) synthase
VKEPIVITAAGAICAAGESPRQILENLRAGRSAFGPLAGWDASTWPAPLAGCVEKIDAGSLFEDRKLLKSVQRLRRTDLLGLYAASRAVLESGMISYRAALEESARTEFNERTAVFSGCGGVGYCYQYDFFPALAAAGGELQTFGEKFAVSVNPTWLLQSLPNNALCYLGIAFGFKGANTCITNHGVSGTQAICEAFYALRDGLSDRAVAIGHHSPIEPEMILNLYHLGLLSSGAMRPFDAARSGFILGEGAGAIVLETQSAARTRGATVLGEILGAGLTTGAAGILPMEADSDAPARAVGLALEEAGIAPHKVALVVAHGDATAASDLSEADAIRQVFGSGAPVVTSFKWAFGHTIAAAGALDAVVALECLRAATAPAIASLCQPDPAFHGLNLAVSETPLRGDIALILNRGFGGMSGALVIKGRRG